MPICPKATRQTACQVMLQMCALGWELSHFDSRQLGSERHLTLYFGPRDEAVLDLTVPTDSDAPALCL